MASLGEGWEFLDGLLIENRYAREDAAEAATKTSAEVADAYDRISHPGESDEEVAKRRAREVERERLRALGVRLDG